MTGEELAGVRRQLDMDYVTFGTQVLGYRGKHANVFRSIRRLELSEEVSEKTATKALAALRRRIRKIQNGGY